MELFGKSLDNDIVVIAEIGVNHEGDIDYALKLLKLAAESGADAVKFQSYTPEKYASSSLPERLERVTQFSLSFEEHQQLCETANQLNIPFLSTPLTEDWVEKLDPLCATWKIASGDITFKPVIQNAAQTGKPVIISTGGASSKEVDQAVQWFKDASPDNIATEEQLILMHCVAAYPAPAGQINLHSIPFLQDRYKTTIGWSNHALEPEISLAAVALGAKVIEVHFTDNKHDREFRDHELSFEKEDLQSFIQQANIINSALGSHDKQIQESEKGHLDLIRKGIVAAKPIKAGEVLSTDHLMYARPATEFSSNELDELLGKTVNQDYQSGELILRKSVA